MSFLSNKKRVLIIFEFYKNVKKVVYIYSITELYEEVNDSLLRSLSKINLAL